ncbi:MAG: hypothetical protein CL785_00165 [Chloroflexi bacterium]|nr:hypothetical protein [Chloroflexota bacterium]
MQKNNLSKNPIAMGTFIVAGHAIKHFLNSGFFILLPSLKIGLNLSNTEIGLMSSARSLGGGLANLPAGFVGDRYQRGAPIILGSSIFSVGLMYFVIGSVNNLWVVILAAVCISIGITFYHPAAISTLSKTFPDRKGFAISIHGTGGSIGEALGPLLTGALLAYVIWTTAFNSFGIIGMLSGIFLGLLLWNSDIPIANVTTFKNYIVSAYPLVINPKMLSVLVVVALYGSNQITVMTFFPIYLQSELNYSPSSMSFFVFASQIAGILSQPLMGLISDKYGRWHVLLPAFLILGITSFFLGFVGDGFPLLLIVIVMGLVLFPIMAILIASAIDIVGSDVQATVVSIVFGTSVLISASSPYVSGLIADEFGLGATFQFAGILSIIATLLIGIKWKNYNSA